MIQLDKWMPSYMEDFDYIAIADGSPRIMSDRSLGLDADPRILAGNCFKPGTITKHHLALVENLIRGLAE